MVTKEERLEKEIKKLQQQKKELEDKRFIRQSKEKLKKYEKLVGKYFLKHRKEDNFVHLYYITAVEFSKSDYREGDINIQLHYKEIFHYKNHFSISQYTGDGEWVQEILRGEYKKINKGIFNRYLNKAINYINSLKEKKNANKNN